MNNGYTEKKPSEVSFRRLLIKKGDYLLSHIVSQYHRRKRA